MTREELRNAIAHACDIMHREGLAAMDYMEQLSCSCFKSFEEMDASAGLSTGNNLEAEAAYASLRQGSGQAAGPVLSPALSEVEGEAERLSTGNDRPYDRALAGDYRWSAWAGLDRGLTGDQ